MTPVITGKAKAILVTLFVVATPIVGSIVWDLYSERVMLELQLWSQSVLMQRSREYDKLTVHWDGDRVASLSRIEAALENTGRKPIRSTDLVTPIRVSLDSGQILDVRVNRVDPANLIVRFIVDSARSTVAIDAPLLNPGDRVRFTILADVTPPPGIHGVARIPGMFNLTQTDRRPDNASLLRIIGWPVYLASFGTLLAFLMFCVFLYLSAYVRALRHRWAARPYHPAISVEYRELIALILGPETFAADEIRPILIDTDPRRPLPKAQGDALSLAVERNIRNVRVATEWVTVLFLGLFLLGGAYVVYSLGRAAAG